ncbi:MAG TPA: hypothetical protein VH595_21925 [Verrucomicrobiae bacterium]|jgi:hypothetical protein|nr:hypothetical protein [Verrucomicrobiae bacterium]
MNKVCLAAICGLMLLTVPASAGVQYVETMPPARHPELVYWFWQSNTLAGAEYLRDVENMSARSAYTMTFMTERGVDFYDYATMHGPFAQTVRAAHQRNLKVGLQLWEFWSPMQPRTAEATKSRLPLGVNQAQALVSEGEVVLDADSRANYSVTCTNGRASQPFHSEVLKVFAFRKTADGYYAENSLTDITAFAKARNVDNASVSLAIAAPKNLAGYTAYILAAHYYDYPDLFNDVMIGKFREALEHYSDIPFDGTALDEFGYMMVTRHTEQPFRDRFYGRAFDEEFARRTGMSLERTLFDMRFAPEGNPKVRMRAINQYFDVMRDGPLRVEKAFYKMSKEIFGPNTFAGIHNTFHNTMKTDDLWRVGFDWWTVPREYGQSDEGWPMPQRMGLIAAHSEPVAYDQYYGRGLNGFLQKAFGDARFGGRVDYHGWNDTAGRWGINLADTEKYSAIRDAELKIRLLNQFNPAAPKLSVLIVFGMPALIDWFPDETARSVWDINGKLGIEEKALAVWRAGYPCALLPSDLIDTGQITCDAGNHPIINGHRFDCMVFLDPQYAKETTLRFLERFVGVGGRLMLEGSATRDFGGRDISARFQKIAAGATVRGFDVARLPDVGARTNSFASGALMEDGAVVFTDFSSWRKNKPKPFEMTLNGHKFSGTYLGVCALKTDNVGNPQKFVCGGFSELRRDGTPLFSLDRPADVEVTRNEAGDYDAIVVSSETNEFRVHQK